MSYGLYVSAAGAQVQSQRLEILSNNLANADTPGFKREMAVPQARHAEAIEQGLDSAGSGSMANVGGGVFMGESITDFSPGRLRRTDAQSDFAIKNDDAFFLVQRGDESLLTRAGNFQFESSGRLVSSQGYPVLDSSGTPITIDPSLPWQLSERGEIMQAGSAIPLAVVKPPTRRDLEHVGENLFRSRTSIAPSPSQVASGYLELSTVSPTTEMMHLIEASRAYEANVRLIQNHDTMLGSLIGRVLRA